MSFQINNNEIWLVNDVGVACKYIGTLMPYNEEQFCRLLYRAFEAGRINKAYELRQVLEIRP